MSPEPWDRDRLRTCILGAVLIEHREHAGLSQKAAAAAIDDTGGTLSRWEDGKCVPNTWRLQRYAERLGTTVDALFKTVDAAQVVAQEIAKTLPLKYATKDTPWWDAARDLLGDRGFRGLIALAVAQVRHGVMMRTP